MYRHLLSRVSLSVAESRDLNDTLALIVEGLVNELSFALARIWFIEPDLASSGAQEKILRLWASAGSSIAEPGVRWVNRDGRFGRIPLGQRKVGRVGLTGEAVIVEDLTADSSWVAEPEWIAREAIVSFAAHPVVFQGKVTGVLGVFSRQRLTLQELKQLRLFADYAAVSFANARIFEELNQLRGKLELENAYLQEELRESMNYGEIAGQSAALRRVLQQIDLVAPTDAAVLILGESGTGKELVARAIHQRSRRNARPMVKVNCASVPRELFESEFFGHAKGSFTGAVKDRVGRFQLSDQGTLFLDEVGEIPIELQSKLLRVLQEGEFERVGEDTTRKVDVRIITSTNRDLGAEAQQKRFRDDLYYRISVFPIVVPPLRERKEDIPLLAAQFISLASRRMTLPEPQLTEQHLRMLAAYDWPGNIRELQHVIERAVILGQGERLIIDPALSARSPAPPALTSPAVDCLLTMEEFRQLEIRNYQVALKRTGGRVYGPHGAAALLGIPATTLASRMKALGINGALRASAAGG
jgi:transcriptional regulator with GAF, ATPase, and Fis domain